MPNGKFWEILECFVVLAFIFGLLFIDKYIFVKTISVQKYIS